MARILDVECHVARINRRVGSITVVLGLLMGPLRAATGLQAEPKYFPLPSEGVVRRITFSGDGKYIATVNGPATITVLEAASGKVVWTTMPDPKAKKKVPFDPNVGVAHVAFSPDSKLLASASKAPGTFTLWEASTGKQVRTVAAHDNWVGSTAFSPDGKVIATAGSGKATVTTGARDSGGFEDLKLWDVATGKLLRPQVTRGSVNAVAISADGKFVAVTGHGLVEVWNLGSGEKVWTLEGSYKDVSSHAHIAIHPKRNLLAMGASGLDDPPVDVWDLETGKRLYTLGGYTFAIQGLAFSPDGETLAAGDGSKIVLWDIGTGRELRTLGKEGSSSMAFSPEGRFLATNAKGRFGYLIWTSK